MLFWDIYSYHFFLKSENLSFGSIANNYWFYPNDPPNCQYQPNATLVQTFYWSGNYENSAAVVEWEAWADDGTNILILDYEDTDIVYPNECLTIGLTGNKLKVYKEENKGKNRKERTK